MLTYIHDRESDTLLVRRSTPEEPTDCSTPPTGLPPETPPAGPSSPRPPKSLDQFALGVYEPFRWTSSDGAEVEGVLIKPVDFEEGQRYPLIVQVHGGPAGTSTNAFSDSWGTYGHVCAGRGYLVFQAQLPRLELGYGEDFRTQPSPATTSGRASTTS